MRPSLKASMSESACCNCGSALVLRRKGRGFRGKLATKGSVLVGSRRSCISIMLSATSANPPAPMLTFAKRQRARRRAVAFEESWGREEIVVRGGTVVGE